MQSITSDEQIHGWGEQVVENAESSLWGKELTQTRELDQNRELTEGLYRNEEKVS